MHGQSGVSKQNTMKPRLKSTPAARELIKRYQPYLGIAEKGADGHWSVGYGHKAAARDGVRVTEDEASLLLIYDILQIEEAIDGVIAGELSQQQRDALVSFVHGVGIPAFKQSDVARYLFEGRSMAAGEAIALYGEQDTDRREAESGLFLTTFAPPKRPPSAPKRDAHEAADTVELQIKIEHEPAAMPVAAEAEPVAPAPPPMPDSAQSRREAEDEIARILASVGSLPAADLAGERIAEAPLHPAEPVMDVALEAVELPRTEPEAEVEPEPEMLAPPVEAAPEAEIDPEPDSEPDSKREPAEKNDRPSPAPLGFAAAPIFAAVPLDRLANTPTPAEDASLDAADPGEADTADEEPVAAEKAEAAETPVIETPVDPVLADDRDPVEAAVASFAPETETDTAQRVIDRMVEDVAQEEEAAPAAEAFVERHLPIGKALGYVLAGELVGRIETETIEDEPATDLEPEAETSAVEDAGDTAEAEPEALEAQLVARMEEDLVDTEAEAAEEARLEAEEFEIVEATIASQTEDTPPPHPADTPADAAGEVGEVEVETDAQRPNADVLGEDIIASDFDPIQDQDFTPQDLAGGETIVADEKPTKSEGGYGLGYFLIALAFAVAAGIGWLWVAFNWQRVVTETPLNLEVAMAVFGTAGMVVCLVVGFMDLGRKLKARKASPAE